MSIKSKVSTCVKKIVEAAKAYESLNNLEDKGNPSIPKPQFFLALDSGKKSHIAGYGRMFENFLETQELGEFSGKGTKPVFPNDANHRNALIQIETYGNENTMKRKRKVSGENKS